MPILDSIPVNWFILGTSVLAGVILFLILWWIPDEDEEENSQEEEAIETVKEAPKKTRKK